MNTQPEPTPTVPFNSRETFLTWAQKHNKTFNKTPFEIDLELANNQITFKHNKTNIIELAYIAGATDAGHKWRDNKGAYKHRTKLPEDNDGKEKTTQE